jgi:hypothetical protein
MLHTRLFNTLLNLSYEDIVRSCDVNQEAYLVCKDPVFWEQKAQRDYKTSLRQVESSEELEPQEKYLVILSQKDVARGSEKYIEPRECFRRAVAIGRIDLCIYFIEKAGVRLDEALIEAVKDKDIFDDLVSRYQFDIYADPDLLHNIYLEAIRNKNSPLIQEILSNGPDFIINDEDVEELMNQAVSTYDYEFIENISNYFFPEESADRWLLEAALLNNDNDFAENIINIMIDNGQIKELARIFIRAGEEGRLRDLIQSNDFRGKEYIGRDILLDAVQYSRLPIIKLIAEDPVFQVRRRRSWFEAALDLSRSLGNLEITSYLTDLLRKM